MQLFRRPGFIAASALTVLLVLSSARVLPADVFFSWMTRRIVTPLFSLMRFRGAAEEENRLLRALLQQYAGDRSLENFRISEENGEQDIIAWTTARGITSFRTARVLAPVYERGSQLFLLNRGARDGVRLRATVITGKGFLAGRIVRVRDTTSFLELLTARGQRFSVLKENGDAPIGMTEGRGDEVALTLDLVPREASVASKDSLVTSGLDDGVPRGLLIGTLRDLSPLENSPWQRGTVDPFVRGYSLVTVGVLVLPDAL